MKKLGLALAASSALVLASPALAGPNGNANPNAGSNNGNGGCSVASPGQLQELLILFYQFIEPTGSPVPGGIIVNLGGAISGGFYGNTANAGIDSDAPARGHGVTPSISPGPQTVGGDGPGSGTSIGDFIQSICHG